MTTGKLGKEAVTGAKLSASLLGQLVKNVTYVTAKSVEDADRQIRTAIDRHLPDRASRRSAAGPDPSSATGSTKVAITESFAGRDSGGKRTGWFARQADGGADANDWGVEVHAVCAEL